jgi:hypothetical protein
MAVLAAGALAAAMLWSIAHWTRTRAITDLAATSGHVLTLVTETLAGELAKSTAAHRCCSPTTRD